MISFNILENEEILPNGRPGPFVMFVQASTFSDDELSFTTVMMVSDVQHMQCTTSNLKFKVTFKLLLQM